MTWWEWALVIWLVVVPCVIVVVSAARAYDLRDLHRARGR